MLIWHRILLKYTHVTLKIKYLLIISALIMSCNVFFFVVSEIVRNFAATI